ncbi:transposase, partial [Candidatus Pacearchaeota archaeon]|nr:transposase [Candidatus Pacearchaeota archaeon]
MMKTFKYRIYPNKLQRRKFGLILSNCCFVYNHMLETRKNAWEQEKRSISKYETMKMLLPLKLENPGLKVVHSQSLQDVCARVDNAFKHYFRRCKLKENPGYPRFRSGNRYKSLTFPQSGYKLSSRTIHISKVGEIKIVLHRPIVGKIKTLVLTKDILGKWWASFSCETEKSLLQSNEKAVGIDLGLTHFATLSNGEKIDNPRFFRKDEHLLSRAQRKLSIQEKGSLKRKKFVKRVQHIHEHISNRRNDFAHKLSHYLVQQFQILVFEDLNVENMMHNSKLSKSIADASWSKLIELTSYKAESAGRNMILVNPRYTSQQCSQCNTIVKKALSERTH